MRQSTTNLWQKGLNLDASSIAMTNQLLSGALNATMITMNGNEMILQNDMGNARVEDAYLPAGYVPVGMLEFGGIVYVASYNPLTNSSQIGCFPSPERNISSDETGGPEEEFSDFCSENGNITNYVQKLKLTLNVIRPGDKFSIEMTDPNQFKELMLLVSRGVVTFSVAVIDESGNLIEIPMDELHKYDYDIRTEPKLVPNTDGLILWEDYVSTPILLVQENEVGQEKTKKYSVYKNKLVGDLYLLLKLNVPESIEPILEGDPLNAVPDTGEYISVLTSTKGEVIDQTKPIIGVRFPTYYTTMDGFTSVIFNDSGLLYEVYDVRTLHMEIENDVPKAVWKQPGTLLNIYTSDLVFISPKLESGEELPPDYITSQKAVLLCPVSEIDPNKILYVLYDETKYCKLTGAHVLIDTWECTTSGKLSATLTIPLSTVIVDSKDVPYTINVVDDSGNPVEDNAALYNYIWSVTPNTGVSDLKELFNDSAVFTYELVPNINIPKENDTCQGRLQSSKVSGEYKLPRMGSNELIINPTYWVDVINNDLYLSFNNQSYLRRGHIITESSLELQDKIYTRIGLDGEYANIKLAGRENYNSYIERLPIAIDKIAGKFNVTKPSNYPGTLPDTYNWEDTIVKNSVYTNARVKYVISSKYNLDSTGIVLYSDPIDLITFNPDITLTAEEHVYDIQQTDASECTVTQSTANPQELLVSYKPELALVQRGELEITSNSDAITVSHSIVTSEASELSYDFTSELTWTNNGDVYTLTVNETYVLVTIMGPTFESCSSKIEHNVFYITCYGQDKNPESHPSWHLQRMYSENKDTVFDLGGTRVGNSFGSSTSKTSIKKYLGFTKDAFYIFGSPSLLYPCMPTWAALTTSGDLIFGPVYQSWSKCNYGENNVFWPYSNTRAFNFVGASPSTIQDFVSTWCAGGYLQWASQHTGTRSVTFILDLSHPYLYSLQSSTILLLDKEISYAKFPIAMLQSIGQKYNKSLVNTGSKLTLQMSSEDFFMGVLEYLQFGPFTDIPKYIESALSHVYIKNPDQISKSTKEVSAFAGVTPSGSCTATWVIDYDCGKGSEFEFRYKMEKFQLDTLSKLLTCYGFDGKLLSDSHVKYRSDHSKRLKDVTEFESVAARNIKEGQVISGTVLSGLSDIALPNTFISSKVYYYEASDKLGIPKYLTVNASNELVVLPDNKLMTKLFRPMEVMNMAEKPVIGAANLEIASRTGDRASLLDPTVFWGNIFDYTPNE